MATHTRVHVNIDFADPYLDCNRCRKPVTGWHNNDACGCDSTWWNVPCGCERAGVTSVCPSWGPVDGCRCERVFGAVDHREPEAGR